MSWKYKQYKIYQSKVDESGFPSKCRLRSFFNIRSKNQMIFKTSYKTLLVMIFISNSYEVNINRKNLFKKKFYTVLFSRSLL